MAMNSASDTPMEQRLSWSSTSDSYDFGRPLPAAVLQKVMANSPFMESLAKSSELQLIYEPGAGTGRVLLPIAQQFPTCRYLAVDKSREMLKVFLQRTALLPNVQIEILNADIADYVPANSPALIIISSLLHSITEWKEVLTKLAEQVGPNGQICLLGEEADLFNLALGRKPNVLHASGEDAFLRKFWDKYQMLRANVWAECAEASQVGCKWDAENSEITRYLESIGFQCTERHIENWSEKIRFENLLSIVERRCYSSMFTVEDSKYQKIVQALKQHFANEQLTVANSRHLLISKFMSRR